MKHWIWSTLKSVYENFVKRLIFFGRNSAVHGLKYVFQAKGSAISRCIWLLILLMFVACLYSLLMPVVLRGGSVSVTPDTRYLNWNTKFPGVTVCEKYTPKTVQKIMLESYPDFWNSLNFDYRRYIADLLYGRGICGRSLCLPCGTPVPCSISWRNVIDTVHKKCKEMIDDCRFNNEKFSCCEQFSTVDSEYGPCISFNSLQAVSNADLQFIVNRTTGPGVLSFRLLVDAHISVHSCEELSTNVLDKKFKFDVNTYEYSTVDYIFSIVELDNDPVLEYEDIDVRRCRYEYEIPKGFLHTYQIYSYGACRLAQNTEKSYNICGCVHPVRDIRYKDFYCNYTGLNCLLTYEAEKSKLGKDVNSSAEECLPSCMESEIDIIHILKDIKKKGLPHVEHDGTLINIRMVSLPTMRYQKKWLRTHLDFVVTVGGIVGLFFGASILSFAELFHLIFRSPK